MARPRRVEEIARRFEAAQRAKILAAWDTLSRQLPTDEILSAMRQGVEAVTALLVATRLADKIIEETVMPLVEAMRAGGVNAAGPFRIAFDLPDPQGMSRVLSTADIKDWLRYNVTPEDREFIRGVIQNAFMEGGHPYETARLIRDHIGVNRVQAGALDRFARGLPSSMTPAERERAIARQTERYIRSRADMIARTETMRAAREGQELAWQQAVAEGELDPDGAYRILIPAGDACQICADIAADSEAGQYPLRSSLPETHPNCRCSEGLTYELKEPARVGGQEAAGPRIEPQTTVTTAPEPGASETTWGDYGVKAPAEAREALNRALSEVVTIPGPVGGYLEETLAWTAGAGKVKFTRSVAAETSTRAGRFSVHRNINGAATMPQMNLHITRYSDDYGPWMTARNDTLLAEARALGIEVEEAIPFAAGPA